jgi:isoleucyl-tRNA synthetase
MKNSNNMTFGYIKINHKISQIFINQSDQFIEEKVDKLKSEFEELDLIFDWDNFYSDRQLYELEEFMRTK